MRRRGSCVAEHDWTFIAAGLEAGLRPVLPIGAAAKEHGWHLPVCTDAVQADWLGSALAARWPVLVWPTLTYGHYPAFLDYPGSTSVPAEAFTASVAAILDSIAPYHQIPALLLNTGISTIAPLDALVESRGDSTLVVHTNRGPDASRTRAMLCSQCHGGHADEAETSVMLAIAPDRVALERAQPWDESLGSGPLSRTPGPRTYTPTGVMGRPDLATRHVGQQLLAAVLIDVARVLGAARAVTN
ncbi:MAG: creatininase family protein [Pseudomonadota bacterium]